MKPGQAQPSYSWRETMSHAAWTVKSMNGKKLGFIKKLIIDSRTRQIAYADLALESSDIIRIPWNILAVKNHGILLKVTKKELAAALSTARFEELPEPVTLEVTMTGRP
jgi:hypothetical protein